MTAGERPPLPQGLDAATFRLVSLRVRQAARGYGNDIGVHGSRANHTAETGSDLDIAIRVDAATFARIHQQRFGQPNPGSAKARTRQHALATGKIQAGELGLRSLRREVSDQVGIEIDIAVVRIGSPFDRGPWIPLWDPAEG